jgi:hypothetical protein
MCHQAETPLFKFLIGAEHQGLLALVDLAHEELYPITFPLGDDDFAIEVPSCFY